MKKTKQLILPVLLAFICLSNYSGAQGTWAQKTSLTGTPRWMSYSFSIGSKGYLGSGSISYTDGGAFPNDLWEYDPSNDSWTQKANCPGAGREGAVGFSIGTKGYMGTGYGAPSAIDFYEYNSTTNTWTQKANFGGAGRYGAFGFSIGTKGYIGSGTGGQDFWEYDSSNDTWLQKANYPGSGWYTDASFSIGSKGYAGTGTGNSDFWEYNPANDTWTQKASVGGVGRQWGRGLAIGNKGYIGMGSGNDFWEYTPSTDSWVQMTNYPGGTSTQYLATFSINNKGYFGSGGIFGGTSVNEFYEFTPAACIVNIPDANFKTYLLGNGAINTNNDGEIQCSEAIAFVGQINVSNLGITDLTGIEAFVNINDLNCSQNSLTSLNVTANTALTTLYCWNNQLTSLNVSANTALNYLDCDNNTITSLTVTSNTALISLACYFNQLTTLNVSSNTALHGLVCSNNQLTSLNLSSNIALNNLVCHHNQLTSLNIQNGNNSNMGTFNTTINPGLTCIQVDNVGYMYANWPSAKDVGASYSLNCSACIVTIPDANFKTYLLGNSSINTNSNTEIECAEATAFTGSISVGNLGITNLTGIEAFVNITQLYCQSNALTSLDVLSNTALTYLDCYNNQLTSLNLTANTALNYLDCTYNQLTSLNITANTALNFLDCNNNQLTSLNVSGNTSLTYLYCYTNQLTSLNVSANTALVYLQCWDNQLTSLNLPSANAALFVLNCSSNLLTSLNVSAFTSLTHLYCNINQLTSLNIQTGNSFFYNFDATNNPGLTCIQVDNVGYMYANWASAKPAGASYSINCAGGCTSAPAPPIVTGPNAVCQMTTGTYTATSTGAISYTWTVPAGLTITSGQGTATLHVNIGPGTINGNVTATATNACGTSAVTNYLITKKPQTPANISGPTDICGMTSATYFIPATFGATSYTWTIPAGMTLTGGAGTNSVTVTIASTFTFGGIKVSAVNACGSIPGTILAVYGKTAPNVLTGPNNVCGMTTATYTCNTVSNATSYWWIVPASWTFTGQGTNTIVATMPANVNNITYSGTVKVHAVSACGNSADKAMTVSYCKSSISMNGGAGEESSISIYPNPATGQLTVNSGQVTVKEIQMYNVLGECVFKSELNNNQSTINISDLLKGMYFVRLTDADNNVVYSERVIKQ